MFYKSLVISHKYIGSVYQISGWHGLERTGHGNCHLTSISTACPASVLGPSKYTTAECRIHTATVVWFHLLQGQNQEHVPLLFGVNFEDRPCKKTKRTVHKVQTMFQRRVRWLCMLSERDPSAFEGSSWGECQVRYAWFRNIQTQQAKDELAPTMLMQMWHLYIVFLKAKIFEGAVFWCHFILCPPCTGASTRHISCKDGGHVATTDADPNTGTKPPFIWSNSNIQLQLLVYHMIQPFLHQYGSFLPQTSTTSTSKVQHFTRVKKTRFDVLMIRLVRVKVRGKKLQIQRYGKSMEIFGRQLLSIWKANSCRRFSLVA